MRRGEDRHPGVSLPAGGFEPTSIRYAHLSWFPSWHTVPETVRCALRPGFDLLPGAHPRVSGATADAPPDGLHPPPHAPLARVGGFVDAHLGGVDFVQAPVAHGRAVGHQDVRATAQAGLASARLVEGRERRGGGDVGIGAHETGEGDDPADRFLVGRNLHPLRRARHGGEGREGMADPRAAADHVEIEFAEEFDVAHEIVPGLAGDADHHPATDLVAQRAHLVQDGEAIAAAARGRRMDACIQRGVGGLEAQQVAVRACLPPGGEITGTAPQPPCGGHRMPTWGST